MVEEKQDEAVMKLEPNERALEFVLNARDRSNRLDQEYNKTVFSLFTEDNKFLHRLIQLETLLIGLIGTLITYNKLPSSTKVTTLLSMLLVSIFFLLVSARINHYSMQHFFKLKTKLIFIYSDMNYLEGMSFFGFKEKGNILNDKQCEKKETQKSIDKTSRAGFWAGLVSEIFGYIFLIVGIIIFVAIL